MAEVSLSSSLLGFALPFWHYRKTDMEKVKDIASESVKGHSLADETL